MHCVNLAALLIRSRCHQGHKRVLLMAGLSFSGGNELFSVTERTLLDVAFSSPGSMKRKHLKVFVVHIEAGTVDFLYLQRFTAFIFHADTSGDNVFFCKNRVGKDNNKIKNRIFAGDFQSFYFVLGSKRSWKTGQRAFSFENFIGIKENLTSHTALCISYIQTALTVIADSSGWVFHWKTVEERRFLSLIDGRGERRLIHAERIQIRLSVQKGSVVNMSDVAFRAQADHIRRILCI